MDLGEVAQVARDEKIGVGGFGAFEEVVVGFVGETVRVRFGTTPGR